MSDAKSDAAAASKGKPWLMILIVLAALAVGGGGAMFYVGTQAAKQAKTEAEDKEDSKPKEPAQYVELDPPFVVNFEAKGVMRFLQVTIEVMTRDVATIDLLKQNDPMIRNDLIMLFGNQRYENISTREGKEKLRAEALQVIADVVTREGGDGSKVEQLYFTSFVMQ